MIGSGVAAPVVAGLTTGIVFVVIFSLFSAPRDLGTPLNRNEHIAMEIENLKEPYRAGEPISFSVHVGGTSADLCNDPQVTAAIVGLDKDKPSWSTPPAFQTGMGCRVQGIDREWRFGYEGEELPYQSALMYDEKRPNYIAIEEADQYKLVAGFDRHVVEKEFAVISPISGKTITAEKVP